MSILLAEKNTDGFQAAVMRNGKLYSFRSESGIEGFRENAVLWGITERAVKGIHGVFVRLPNHQAGFLPVPENSALPASGIRMIVQIRHPAAGKKKAMLTDDISLPGADLVFLPGGKSIVVSSRLSSEQKQQLLLRTAELKFPEEGGFILRSASFGQNPELIEDEAKMLVERWHAIECSAASASDPAVLWPGEDMISRLMAEEANRLECIVTNVPERFRQPLICPVNFCEQPFRLYNVMHHLDRDMRRCIRLRSGATLVIDPCEAMTVIDVNSGSATGRQNIPVKINQEAALEISRLLRLREIGGIVLIDFIDMSREEDRMQLMNTMKEALKEDPVKTVVHDITRLGLMELTRKRESVPLLPVPDQPCPYCSGTGVFCLSDYKEENCL